MKKKKKQHRGQREKHTHNTNEFIVWIEKAFSCHSISHWYLLLVWWVMNKYDDETARKKELCRQVDECLDVYAALKENKWVHGERTTRTKKRKVTRQTNSSKNSSLLVMILSGTCPSYFASLFFQSKRRVVALKFVDCVDDIERKKEGKETSTRPTRFFFSL